MVGLGHLFAGERRGVRCSAVISAVVRSRSDVESCGARGLPHHQLMRGGHDPRGPVVAVDALDEHVQGDAGQEGLVRAHRRQGREGVRRLGGVVIPHDADVLRDPPASLP